MHLHLPSNVLRALTSPAHICTHPGCLLRCPVPSGSSAGSGAPSPRSRCGDSPCGFATRQQKGRGFPELQLQFQKSKNSICELSHFGPAYQFTLPQPFPSHPRTLHGSRALLRHPAVFTNIMRRQTMNGHSLFQPVVDTQQKRIIINFPSALCLDNVPPTPLEPSVPPSQPASQLHHTIHSHRPAQFTQQHAGLSPFFCPFPICPLRLPCWQRASPPTSTHRYPYTSSSLSSPSNSPSSSSTWA